MTALLSVETLTKRFGRGTHTRTALDSVSFDLREGEVLGLVGESGSGKSTTVRCLVGLERPDSGAIVYDGMDMIRPNRCERKRFRDEVQMVFQDPYSSLDPRMTILRILEEPLLVRGGMTVSQRRDRIVETLQSVGLDASHLGRYPRSFSGGQRQRIAIARALVVRPRVLICDEPVSALDVSVQAQVLNLLKTMQKELSITVLFIAHDLAVVRYLCDRVVVLQHGVVAETGSRDDVYGNPTHAYTQSLLEAIPRADPAGERERRRQRRQRALAATERTP